MIFHELDECLEIYFVMEGKYNVGYQINNTKFWRRQFGHSTVIGGFQLAFMKKFLFHYKARTLLKCYGIRRKNWLNLMDEFPRFNNSLKVKFFNIYVRQVYWPILKFKNIDIAKYNKRRDFEQVLVP